MAEIKKQDRPNLSKQSPVPADIKKQQAPVVAREKVKPASTGLIFTKENYRWMVIGGAIVILGMILMSGGINQNPDTLQCGLQHHARNHCPHFNYSRLAN